MVVLLVIKFALLVVAGLCNAVMDTLTHHWTNSVFARLDFKWWNPAFSWSNKYRLSKWIPDAFTDGWHLFKWLMLAFLFGGVALPSGFIYWYVEAVFCWGAFFIGFWLGYNKLFVKK